MIKFTNKDDNKQFISITVSDNTPTKALCENIKEIYSSLQQANIIYDDSEIVIELDNSINYGFSLSDLREHIKTVAAATVSHFSVDINKPTQRYYG